MLSRLNNKEKDERLRLLREMRFKPKVEEKPQPKQKEVIEINLDYLSKNKVDNKCLVNWIQFQIDENEKDLEC